MKNIRKGIILAGGNGTRLKPLTDVINKQLLPIYNKPMIFYPLSILINIGIKEILVISDSINMPLYKKLLKDGKQFGVKINYKIQKKADGIASAYLLGKKFLNNFPSVLILGDNIFYGSTLIKQFKKALKSNYSTLFTYSVEKPNAYGVFINDNKKRYIIEKPKITKSNRAIVGIYFLDNKASLYASKLKPSSRNELEISDLNNIFLKDKKTKVINLGHGTAWLDTGSFEGLLNASNFVRTIETRQGIDITSLNKK